MTDKEPQGLLLTESVVKRTIIKAYKEIRCEGYSPTVDMRVLKPVLMEQVQHLELLGYRKLPAPGTEEYQKLRLTKEEIEKHGYGWMQNYDYEIKAILQVQVEKVLALLRGEEK